MAIKAISVHRTLTSSTDIDGVIGNKQIQARILIYIYVYMITISVTAVKELAHLFMAL